MNFLSHYYFTQHKNDAYYTLGSVLPDLLRNHNAAWKPNPEKRTQKFKNDPHLNSLLRGWELHLQVDKLFHSSSIFLAACSSLRKDLAPIFMRLPIRPFFLAHVGYELILDSLLIQNKEIETEAFYQELASCEPIIIQEFLSLSGIYKTDDFLTFLNSFIQSKYLNSYTETKNIVYALDQIGKRVWVEPFNQEEKEQAILVFDSLKTSLNPTFMTIFKQIENAL